MSLIAICLLAVQAPTLFSIGTVDQSPREFRLAPSGYHNYDQDSLFIVGRSTAQDWNYVLPGPDDMWAGSRSHEAEIVFSLDKVPTAGSAKFLIDLSDAHYASPPHLQILLNGRVVGEADTKHGESDATIDGKQLHGTVSEVAIPIQMSAFKKGVNTLTIRNATGSWLVFDALRMEAPAGAVLGDVPNKLIVEHAPQRQAILKTPKGLRQPVSIAVTNLGQAGSAILSGPGVSSQKVQLRPGRQTVEAEIAPVKKQKRETIRIDAAGSSATISLIIKPVRPWTIYLLPHSHVDIGYTNLQSYILKLHERNIGDALEVAKESRSYASDDRFRFNIEATWPVDRYVATASPLQVNALRAGLRSGSLHVSASYANLLSGIMNPEEMMQSYRYSRILQDKLGIPLLTASQTDVPGVTWGSVVALHEAGIKYLVLLPNALDRIGGVDVWMNKPFWWASPSGRERILVWEPDTYSVGTSAGWDGDREHLIRTNHPEARFIEHMIFPKLDQLVADGYPYDMIAEPWSVTDNAPVDADVPKAVKAWNEKYAVPRVVTSTLTDACDALVHRYGPKLPVVSGDFTPYWEDGSGSSAWETSMNRETANRLIDAETLFAMNAPNRYPTEKFLEAWRNVLLYSEHTWGAWNSISDPDDPEVKAQWNTKQAFAIDASRQSKSLEFASSPTVRRRSSNQSHYANTLGWSRTALVYVPFNATVVTDERGKAVPVQKTKMAGNFALVKSVGPTAGFTLKGVKSGEAARIKAPLRVYGTTIESRDLKITVDPKTGSISSWKTADGTELVDQKAKYKLGQYLYLKGTDLANIQTLRNPIVEVVDKGPLVASILVRGSAPGANEFSSYLQVVADLDEVRWTVQLNKTPVRDKEAVHIAFPFRVPHGQMRIEMPWAFVRPETDQISGANKNWLPIDNCVDISNDRFGVTCVSLNAPLIEVGGITADLLGSQTDPSKWRQHIAPTSTFYSWALNNHWHTNYRAEQGGDLTFRYVMKVHGKFRLDEVGKFGMEASHQPAELSLLDNTVNPKPLLTVSDHSVLVTRIVPTDDKRAILIRLWNPTTQSRIVRLGGRIAKGARIWRTDVSQHPRERLSDNLRVPGKEVLTIRIETKG